MKKTFLKLGCLLFAIILSLSTLVACFGGDETEETQGGANGEVTPPVEEVPPVPDKDWEGREFSVLSVEESYESNFEIVGAMTGSKISQAVYERNNLIKDKYNVNIAAYPAAKDDGLDTLTAVIEAGDNDYDLVFLYRDNMATAITSGYMKDITTVEYVNLSNKWYNQSTLESMKISGKLFHMASDFSLIDKARTNVLFLNRDLAANNNIPDIVAMVRDGSWTIDKMYTYASQVAVDNGDGIMDLEDQWGLAMGGRETVCSIWNSLGNEVVTVNADNTYSVNLTNDRSLKSIDAIEKLVAPNITFKGNQFGTYDDCFDTFIDERMLFMSETLSTIEKVSPEANFRFTAIPYPKLDTEQTQYYTTNDNIYCATFGIPVCAGDFSFSGFMVETLSWQSNETTFPEYYNVVCKVQNSYDAECAEMLDRIFEGLVFDFGLLYANNIKNVRGLIDNALYKGKDITGEYAGKADSIASNIEMIFESINMNTEAE
ncbi:MAG: extracellular solute-binding protein [Ruminococcaceae bacterium]|nr:extracellular solute-binding protein [Oscillospiraceae bacterium]